MDNGQGLVLTLYDGGRSLKAERSLPKALTGQNVIDLVQDEVPAALEVIDREIAETLGSGLPPFGEWLPVRVDYCRSIPLGDETQVLRTLDRMADIELPWKGLPVRGQARSVAWPKGTLRPKFYSKYLESHDPAALGVLRHEVGVYRAQGIRAVLARLGLGAGWQVLSHASPPPARPDLTVLDALVPEVGEYVRGRYADRLGGGLMTQTEIGNVELVRELVSFFGSRRAASLIGYCAVAAALGATTRVEMLAVEALSLSTRYRVLADIRSFRSHLAEEGFAVETSGDAEEDAALDALISRIAGLARAA